MSAKYTTLDLVALGDVVIVVNGQGARAWIKGNEAPVNLTLDATPGDDLSDGIRQATVKVGWPVKAFKGASDEDVALIRDGHPQWRVARAERSS